MTSLGETVDNLIKKDGHMPTIVQRIQHSATTHANDLAIVCTHQAAGAYGLDSVALEDEKYQESPYIRWTYHSLSQGVRRLTESLAAKSLEPGSPMFLICPNRVEYLLATLSAYNLDMVHVPMNPDDLLNIAEVKHKITTILKNQESKFALFIVDNPTVGERIDQVISDVDIDCFKVIIDDRKDGWVSFRSLMESSNTNEPFYTVVPNHEHDAKSVFFTSGTTSLPKGCLIKPERWMEALELSLSIGSTGPGDFIAVPVPNSHAFGYICLMMSLTRGACIVYAGPKFTPQHTLDAIRRERCTYVALVPTMTHALMQVQSESDDVLTSLKGMLFAGTSIAPETLRHCQKSLGASTVENYYGMTEGVFCSTGAIEDPEQIITDHGVSVGRPVSGSQIRVCAPGEITALPNGSTGELHFSGDTLTDRYIGLERGDFYTSDGQVWFITGDKGRIDSNGSLCIVGRYKDLIIRGGENIAPAKIEGILCEIPQIRALDPQIIAASDPIAGEIPVAVIRQHADNSLVKQLQGVVRSRLGNIYVPSQVITLQALGLHDYPYTMAGKVLKSKLVELFSKWQSTQSNDEAPSESGLSSLHKKVVEVWARVLGLQVDQIDITSSISQIADSIVQLIARDKITKATGRSIPLSQWLSANNIAEQVSLLEQIEAEKRQIKHERNSQPMGPPSTDRIVHLGNDSGALDNTKAAVEDTIASYGLSWNDVEDVVPCSDFIQVISKSRIVDTWNIRTSILSKGANSQRMRVALETALANNPFLLSFVVMDDVRLGPELGLYATMRQSKSFLDRCIQDYGTVDTLQDIRQLTMHHPFKDEVKLPGPCFRALIVFVRETNSAALITNVSHAVLDVVYHTLFNEDIDRALSNQPLSPHVPYKAWADSYHTLRQSPIANTATKYYVSQLRNLKEHKNTLWPSPTDQLTVSPERANLDGHSIVFSAPGFLHLRNKYPTLTAPVILKAALTLLVVSHTKHTHALFVNLEANRSSFPFIPASYSSIGNFDAADVAGPTFTGVMNLIEFQPNETVLQYLSRVQETQISMTQHACVPWHEVFRHLDCSAGDIIPAVAESLIFNWMPGLGAAALGKNPYSNIEVSQTHIRTKLGMLASAGLGGADGSQIVLFLQGALSNMSTESVSRAAEDIKRISLWLADESSWEKPVRKYTDTLKYSLEQNQ